MDRLVLHSAATLALMNAQPNNSIFLHSSVTLGMLTSSTDIRYIMSCDCCSCWNQWKLEVLWAEHGLAAMPTWPNQARQRSLINYWRDELHPIRLGQDLPLPPSKDKSYMRAIMSPSVGHTIHVQHPYMAWGLAGFSVNTWLSGGIDFWARESMTLSVTWTVTSHL